MIFLPIVERELRVAARKRSTFWLRLVAAVVALVIGGGFLVVSMIGPFGASTPSLGKGLFNTLTWLCLIVALASGLFFTSDCLSEEKREGTLGFLFLTDLRGFDVVLGKLMSSSLRGTFALLAVFPILAITLLMGGITGVQFWKTVLAILNALFLSLAAGLFVSALSRDSQKALAGTLLLLILLVAAGPGIDGCLAGISKRAFQPTLSLSSPGFLFVAGSFWPQAPFWNALLVNQLTAWTLLALTFAILPRAWQERAKRTTTGSQGWSYSWKFGGAKSRAALRRRLLAVNPALWLACRERWQSVSLWIVTLLLLSGFAVAQLNGRAGGWQVWSFFSGLFTLGLYLGIASQAGKFFVEARRSGLLELLLVTPLTAQQVVLGQWRAMVRLFGLPLLLCLATQLAGAFLTQLQSWKQISAATTAMAAASTNTALPTNAVTVTNSAGTTVTFAGGTTTFTTFSAGSPANPGALAAFTLAAAGTLAALANLAALIWFGMWMGLTSRSSNLASLKTILFVQIIPWFVITFASGLIVALGLVPQLMRGTVGASPNLYIFWFPMISAALSVVLVLAKDAGFVLYARKKLVADFREQAAQAVASRIGPPAQRPPPASPPPLQTA